MVSKIAVFLSKNGADLQCVIDACADRRVKGRVEFVVSSSEDTPGLNRAVNAGILSVFPDPFRHNDMESFYQEVAHYLRVLEIDWIFLIEYDYYIPRWFVKEFFPRIFGAYPSLDQSFLRKKDSGLLSAIKAIKNSLEETGLILYLLEDGKGVMDSALFIEKVPVFPDTDSPWTLYHRVKKLEYCMIPNFLSKLTSGELLVGEDGRLKQGEVVNPYDKYLI